MAKSVQQSLEIRDALSERISYEFEKVEEGGTNVYFSLKPRSGIQASDDNSWLMLNVTPDTITIFPFTGLGWGYESKYDFLQRIYVTGRKSGPYKEPSEALEVEEILDALPEGLEKNPLNGLGFAVQDRFIPQAIASITPKVSVILITGGNEPPLLDGGVYQLSELYLKQLVRGMRSIGTRYQRQARSDKNILAHNSLLAKVDSILYPPKQKKISVDAVFELVKVGRTSAGIPKAAQRNVVNLVGDNAQAIAKNAPETLYELAAKIESATLQEMIFKYEDMLKASLNEQKWQKFFEANTFILSMAFAVPTIFVQETPYVQGKRVNGQGGKFSDFLMRGQGTGNVALIEIKAPDTALLAAYRNEQQGPSRELAGAITQILGQRRKLTTGWNTLKAEDDGTLAGTDIFSPQAVVLIGSLPESRFDKEAFEAFRSVLKDIAVITFDELLMRLKYLNEALSTERQRLASQARPDSVSSSFTGESLQEDDESQIPF